MAIRTLAVIGAGTMGNGIAQIAATAGLDVILIDVSDAMVEKGLDAIARNLSRIMARGKMSEAEKDAAIRLIRGTTTFEELKPVDVVIEAVTENFDLKEKILKQIDALVRAETIVASNPRRSRSPSSHR